MDVRQVSNQCSPGFLFCRVCLQCLVYHWNHYALPILPQQVSFPTLKVSKKNWSKNWHKMRVLNKFLYTILWVIMKCGKWNKWSESVFRQAYSCDQNNRVNVRFYSKIATLAFFEDFEWGKKGQTYAKIFAILSGSRFLSDFFWSEHSNSTYPQFSKKRQNAS